MPTGASNAKLILSQVGVDPQDNLDPAALQYWANVSRSGAVSIPRVKEGKYRLTLYAEGARARSFSHSGSPQAEAQL